MLLAKSCMKDFNIKNGTIKLGTLHEYRETELQHIADKEEGFLKFNIRFDGLVEITSEWFNTLSGNGVQIGSGSSILFPGSTSAHYEVLNIVPSSNGKIILRDSRATIERQALNGFVFCMSSIRKTKDCIDIFPEYDDYWYIPKMWAANFGFMLGGLLRDAIIERHNAGQPIVPKELSIDDFSVNARLDFVSYTPREIHITNDNKIELNEFMQKMSNIAFIKPVEPFEKEREYRFNYEIVSKGRIIEPTIKSIILDSTPLQQFVI